MTKEKTAVKKTLLLLAVSLGILGIPAKTLAHAMQTNYVFLEELEFQSFYSDGEPAKNAKVLVYAPNNPDEPWIVGKTDEQGRFSFLPDNSIPGEWEVEFEQEGHGDILTIPVSEKGVDPDKISQSEQKDTHYLSLNPWQSLLITSGVGAIGFLSRKKC
ncbi:MAG: carboxypeptidase regulatory-like domain-containing protein [cyanobacterium endosymbiont of Rhopalodia sterrenbergii]